VSGDILYVKAPSCMGGLRTRSQSGTVLFSMSLAVRETIKIVREIEGTRKVQSVSSPSSLLSSHSYSVNIRGKFGL
jgi:hypothetical protein